MTAEEYLVNRIVKLEKELKQSRNAYAGAKAKALMLNETLNHYEMEKEHIKQIITCSIGYDEDNFKLTIGIGEEDFKTLLAILDIGPEDYSESQKDLVYEFDNTYPNCEACIHKDISPFEDICFNCGPQYKNFERRQYEKD